MPTAFLSLSKSKARLLLDTPSSFARVLVIVLKIFALFFILTSLNVHSDTTEEQNIVEKAKDINKKIKEKQAATQSNIDSEIGKTEEPLPLNDPFAGDSSLGSTAMISGGNKTEERSEMSLYNFKLVGIIEGSYEVYTSLVNSSGEVITLQLHEELSEGVKLVDIRINEAIFQKEDGTYMIINFKNQIKESDEY